jgi:hypothetical protein
LPMRLCRRSTEPRGVSSSWIAQQVLLRRVGLTRSDPCSQLCGRPLSIMRNPFAGVQDSSHLAAHRLCAMYVVPAATGAGSPQISYGKRRQATCIGCIVHTCALQPISAMLCAVHSPCPRRRQSSGSRTGPPRPSWRCGCGCAVAPQKHGH